MCENEPTIYQIPEANLHLLKEKINKLNKRAKKLGCPELQIITHEITHGIHPDYRVRYEMNGCEGMYPTIKVHHISIDGEGPKLNGWKFVGTLDHYSIPNSVIVSAVPGEKVPSKYFDSKPVCDHCNTHRLRVETFVIENEDGDTKQVGRQCLKDFLGHDPAGIARILQYIRQIIDELEDEESDYYRGYGVKVDSNYYDAIQILINTAAIIRTYGWVSRSASKDNDFLVTTADQVISTLNPPSSNDPYYTEWNLWMENDINWDNALDEKNAKAALEWLDTQKDQKNTSEYMHNLLALRNNPYIPHKTMGIWCSLMFCYYRAMERLEERKNEWVGEIKKRQEFSVKVVDKTSIDGYYGTITIVKMRDSEGHTLNWFASSCTGMSIGEEYKIKGTVKKHDEYKGWKTTSLSRVKVIEPKPAN